MEWGDRSEDLVAMYRSRKLAVPRHLLPPDVMYGSEVYIEAFWSLSTDRPVGFSIGMIPFSSIDRYATRYGFDSVEEFSILEYVIRRMDQVYLEAKQRASKNG